MPSRITLVAARAAVVLPTAASLFLAPAAFATPNGDNGTVKIHDAKTNVVDHRNEPHVCTFYLDAFGFDGGQQVDWVIDEWAPTGEKAVTVKEDAITLNGEGKGRTGDLSLPDGHYKLSWNFHGENGDAKHKVFWVDCGSRGPSPSESGQPSGKPSASSATSGNEGVAGGAESSPSPGAKGSAGGLAETGASASTVGLLAGFGALLLLGGAVLTRKRLFGRR